MTFKTFIELEGVTYPHLSSNSGLCYDQLDINVITNQQNEARKLCQIAHGSWEQTADTIQSYDRTKELLQHFDFQWLNCSKEYLTSNIFNSAKCQLIMQNQLRLRTEYFAHQYHNLYTFSCQNGIINFIENTPTFILEQRYTTSEFLYSMMIKVQNIGHERYILNIQQGKRLIMR